MLIHRGSVEDLLLDGDPPQIRITHVKPKLIVTCQSCPALDDELRTHLQRRQQGFLFESNPLFDQHDAISCEGFSTQRHLMAIRM